MSRFANLPGLIEDLRHAIMQRRQFYTRTELETLQSTPAALVNGARRELAATQQEDGDGEQLELAVFLAGQYEEALVRLSSMIPD